MARTKHAQESKNRRKKVREPGKHAEGKKRKHKEHKKQRTEKESRKKKATRNETPERPKRVIKRFRLLNAECNRAQKFSLKHFALRRAPFRRRLYKQVMQIGGKVERYNKSAMYALMIAAEDYLRSIFEKGKRLAILQKQHTLMNKHWRFAEFEEKMSLQRVLPNA